MIKPPNKKRSVNGILLLDKPTGFSSNAVLQKVKRIFNAKKAGHTGSLDPLASGMLPICFGEATKFSQFLLESDKTYRVAAFLGIRTTTSDKEGEVVEERSVPPLTLEEIDRQFDSFRGDIQQIPSMYSALKYQGQPLYKYARQGITVERPSRPVTIYDLTVTQFKNAVVEFDLKCSKGTYVRTLVDDFGEVLGCGAHVIALRRLLVGPYPAEGMITMEKLEAAHEDFLLLDSYLLPVSTSVGELPEIALTESMVFYLRQGQPVLVSNAPSSGLIRITTKKGAFLGVGEMLEGQRLAPRRLVQMS